MQELLLSDFDYELPETLIAQRPTDRRENSRMMVLDRNKQTIDDKHFYNIVDLIDKNSILILNNTKVIPARIYAHKETGALIEILLLKQVPNNKGEGDLWDVLIRPSKRVKPDMILKVSEELSICIKKRLEDDGEWLVELIYNGNLYEILDKVGNIPLPPYIERKVKSKEIIEFDKERYQTVYAKYVGSVAAPTAGLHFTKEILTQLKEKGIEIAYVTLNVGLGTFRPVKCKNVLEHKMHSEEFAISKETADKINKAKNDGKTLIAVGTTTVRTLETAYQQNGCIKECHGASELFIYPPYDFKIVDNLITNFHLPKSTLLMLVSALSTKDFIFKAYKHAVEDKYRFFSYGDCMYIK